MKVLYSFKGNCGNTFEVREALPEGHTCWLIMPSGKSMQCSFPLEKVLELVEENEQLKGAFSNLLRLADQ